MNRFYLIFFILINLTFTLNAQSVDFGIGIGGSAYWGDLNAPSLGTNLGNTNIALQGTARLNLNNYLAGRVNLLYGQLKGDDQRSTEEFQKQRNLDFHSHLFELSVMGELHVFGYNLDEDNPISPYLTAGVGVFRFNPTTVFQGDRVELQPLGTEGQGLPGFANKYSRVAVSIPFGAGAKLKMTESMYLAIDVIARRTLTDFIDDVSGNYVNFNELASGNGILAAQLGDRTGEFFGQEEPFIRETGDQRGGASVDDYFFTFMVTLNFKFGELKSLNFGKKSKVYCPKF